MPVDSHIIRYSQCWEDTELMMHALNPTSQDTVLSVTSGGCNTLALSTCHPLKIYAIDNNPAQSFLFQLKTAALENLSYDDLLGFIGIKENNRRKQLASALFLNMPDNTVEFLGKKQAEIEKGIIHAGKFEKYLRLFRKSVLPIVERKINIDKILTISDKEAQLFFFNEVWNNWRWRLLFKLFFNKPVMRKRGRSEDMFRFAVVPTGTTYLQRTQKGLSEGVVSGNRYLEYILKGNFINTLPYYLEKENYQKVKTYKNIEVVNAELLDFIYSLADSSINCFNLSDVFESISEEKTALIFREIVRVGKNGARIIFWNNLVLRDIPEKLLVYFHKESEKEKELRVLDKVFFYERFNIYTLVK